MSSASRGAEVAAGLDVVRSRVRDACDAAGRDHDEVAIVVVTKFFPAADVRLLSSLGIRHVGENRHQEAVAKREELVDLDLTWHFIGGLQSNKAAAVGAWADVVQSVDRAKLLHGLARAAHERDRTLDVLLQVGLDREEHGDRSGVALTEVVELARAVAETEGLRLRGVMGIAPLGGDPKEAFTRLGRAAVEVRDVVPSATWVSAGMSGDLEAAIHAGATHVRVGSAVLGNRPPHR